MKRNQSIEATFSSREMEAIANLLLSNKGINIDPIIDDLYPCLKEEDKSLFRCKISLLLSDKLPAFQVYEGYRMDGIKKCVKLRCIAESSLLGVKTYEIIEIWRKKDNDWVASEDPYNEIGSYRTDSPNLELYNSLEEAEKNW